MAEDAGELAVVVDIATTDITRKKSLFLNLTHGEDRYTISVGARDLGVQVKRRNEYGFQSVPPAMRDRVLGYALRRAICRGFDKVEIIETDTAATIDLGELPK